MAVKHRGLHEETLEHLTRASGRGVFLLRKALGKAFHVRGQGELPVRAREGALGRVTSEAGGEGLCREVKRLVKLLHWIPVTIGRFLGLLLS